MVSQPKNSFTPCEDFFLLLAEAHIVAAALKVFKMSSVDSTPCTTLFPEGSSDLDSLQRRNVLMLAVNDIVEEFVDISFGMKKPTKKKQKKTTKNSAKKPTKKKGQKAKELPAKGSRRMQRERSL